MYKNLLWCGHKRTFHISQLWQWLTINIIIMDTSCNTMMLHSNLLLILNDTQSKDHDRIWNVYHKYVIWATTISIKLAPYLLTPWSRVLLEKLAGSAASQEIPNIFGTRRFITIFTSARHLSLSWANSIQSSQPPPTSWRSIFNWSSLACRMLPTVQILTKIRLSAFHCHTKIFGRNVMQYFLIKVLLIKTLMP